MNPRCSICRTTYANGCWCSNKKCSASKARKARIEATLPKFPQLTVLLAQVKP